MPTPRNRRRSNALSRLHAPMAIVAVMLLIASGCGARLTKAQMSALNGSSNGGSGGGNGGSVAAGSNSGGTATGASESSGNAAVPIAGSPTSVASGAPSIGGTGASGGTSNSGAHPAAAGQPTTVTQAGNPLAGPGGKVCVSGAPGSGPGVTSSSITVGTIATVNGPVPGLFAGARYGAQAVADYINSTGGICGRKLVVNSADDQFDQATNQQEAGTMANSVLAFMGSFSLQDGGITAGAPGVPDIGEAISASRFNAATNFSPQPNPPGYNEGMYQYIKSLPQYAAATQHMAMLVENTPQTATTGKYEQAALQAAGYKFVFTDNTLQPTDPTFNGDVQKMKSAGVEGVIFQATGTIIGQLANAMYAAGMKIVLGNYCPSGYDPSYIKNAGPGASGTLISQSLALFDGEDAATVPMVSTLDQWYGRVNPGQVPDLYATYAWMSGLMLAQALNESGNVSRAGLLAGLKTLTNFDGDGLSAPSNPVSKAPPSCYLLITVQNGKFVRAPQSAHGFICSPAGYYHYAG